MGLYTHIQGFVSYTEEEHAEAARAAIEAHVSRAPTFDVDPSTAEFYNQYWLFSPPFTWGGGMIAYGGIFRNEVLPYVRSQVEAVARVIYNPEVSEDDPSYFQGVFYVSVDEWGDWRWLIRGGAVHEEAWEIRAG